MSPAVRCFALTTCGLEDVSAREIAALPGVRGVEVAYRRISFTYDASLAALLRLRTVDDAFLDLAGWTGIGHARATLTRLRQLSARLDLHAASQRCAGFRRLPTRPTFSTTASFVGHRNYTTAEIKAAVADGIARANGWAYRHDDARADLNVRVFIEHDLAHVGLRLGARPLHDRPPGRLHRVGALKPSVAAALVALAGVTPGIRVLDPCCGAGAIVYEAGASGAQAYAGDIDPTAVALARANAGHPGGAGGFVVLDAQRLPFGDGSVDRIISNLPWGRQVPTDAPLPTFYWRAMAEMRRTLVDDGRLVMLTGAPDLACLPTLRCVQRREISLHGQRPTILEFTR
jgi:tRNA (guanine6-N2)-methyltransferase